MGFSVIYDVCVQYPAPFRDFLMGLALLGLFAARSWTIFRMSCPAIYWKASGTCRTDTSISMFVGCYWSRVPSKYLTEHVTHLDKHGHPSVSVLAAYL